MIAQYRYVRNLLIILSYSFLLFIGCQKANQTGDFLMTKMNEHQITFSPKNHALDNNDNFSPDGKYLCYDTRGTVYNENLANCKSIEKVNISTGEETVLWKPNFVTGEEAAPGVAAASYHPTTNKVIFIHGPFLDEIKKRGYYSIRNRSAIEVDGDGEGKMIKVDYRDIENKSSTPGAHRGGTHRHEYTRKGNRIGFTYDDFIIQDYDRTIGFMEKNENAPQGYTHYFSLILKPAKKGEAKPGEIEKAWDDSWVDSAGTMRVFIGKVRNANKIDYDYDIFVADIPLNVDITTAYSGSQNEYPRPAKGISIRRLTNGMKADGIVRASFDGKMIAFTAEDNAGTLQIFLIASDGSMKKPLKITDFSQNAYAVRWHPGGDWVFSLCGGDIYATNVYDFENAFSFKLNEERITRDELVVSHDGNLLAYDARVPTRDKETKLVKDAAGKDFTQIFIMEIEWDKLLSKLP